MKTFIFTTTAAALLAGSALAGSEVLVKNPDGSGWMSFEEYAATAPTGPATEAIPTDNGGVLTQTEIVTPDGLAVTGAGKPISELDGVTVDGNKVIITAPDASVRVYPGD